MERDVKFAFEDILGSPDLLESDILRYGAALKASDSTNTSANLRFLRIPELSTDCTTSNIIYTITDSGQYRDVVDYVAVSYCWDSFAQTNMALSDAAPTISIIDRGITRNSRCPAEVIRRAVNFALARGVSLIWIDQECINQQDDADVQKHLQCMHTIYKQAKFAIGLLNFELKNWNQFMSMINFANVAAYPRQGFNKVYSHPEFLLSVKSIKFMTRLLNSVRMDRWFSRTWVFQERYSAFDMQFLFRVSSEVRTILKGLNFTGPCWEDFALCAGDIGSIPAIWSLILKNTSTETVELNLAFQALHAATQSVCTLFEGITIEMIINKLVTGQDPHATQRPSDGFHLKSVFHHIESCDNQIVSDRVAIFANVVGLDRRMNTTGLSSYSLSLLMLLHINNFLPRVLIRHSDETDFRSRFVLDVDKLVVMEEFLDLKRLIRNGHEGLDEELKAIDRALADILPLEARQYESADAFALDFGEGGPNHVLLPSLINPAGNIKVATIIPMSATIEELFDSVISDTSAKRADLPHSHGSKIVRYAIENGQLPEGSTFLAFYGGYVWGPEFIDEHFVATLP